MSQRVSEGEELTASLREEVRSAEAQLREGARRTRELEAQLAESRARAAALENEAVGLLRAEQVQGLVEEVRLSERELTEAAEERLRQREAELEEAEARALALTSRVRQLEQDKREGP